MDFLLGAEMLLEGGCEVVVEEEEEKSGFL